MTLLSADQIARLHACDTPLDSWPLRSVLPPKERILHIHLDTDDDPQYGMQRALNLWGSDVSRIAWTRVGAEATRRQAVEVCRQQQPTLVWMQLQTPDVLDASTLRQMREAAPNALLVTWCGDVGRCDPNEVLPWEAEVADNVHLCLFSSTTQAHAYRAHGHPGASYLQIGCDTQWFRPANATKKYRVAFLGQNYGTNFDRTLPGNDAALRAEVARALKRRLGRDFYLAGGGWGGLEDAFVATRDSPAVYHQSKLALSISLSQILGRYSSDRLLRALGCGVPTFVREFSGMASWGLVDRDNCIIWRTEMSVGHVVELIAQDWSAEIGERGAKLVVQHHTWEVRVRELAVYLAALRGAEITTETL